MTESLQLSTILPASAQRVYRAWLSSEQHAGFTGGAAEIDPAVGGAFTAWDGYIQGKTLELEPFSRILQSWRTTDFPAGSADSLLEVRWPKLKAAPGSPWSIPGSQMGRRPSTARAGKTIISPR